MAPLALGVIFALALWAPIPTAPNTARAEVMAQVAQRFPGWRIMRTTSSWEGAWSVVVSCGSQQVGFQLVPGHGLRGGDAWLHPQDPYSQARLTSISDDKTYLVWYRYPRHTRSVSCDTELPPPQAHGRKQILD
jgi:hypothetical protein